MFTKYYILTFKDENGTTAQKATDSLYVTNLVFNSLGFVLINSLRVTKHEYKRIGQEIKIIKGLK